MKQKWLVLILLLGSVFFFGCSNRDVQEEEMILVMAEEISYSETGDITLRKVYQYDGDPYHYRCENYDGDRLLTYTEVAQSEDGRTWTEKTYQGEQLLSTEIYQYDADGKEQRCEMVFTDGSTNREWHWSKDGKTVEITDDGIYLWTEEYDAQDRKVRSYGDDYETVYTYENQKKTVCTTYPDEERIEYVVHQYDAQGRVIESSNYELEGNRPYTENDLIARAIFEYEADEHSYWMQSAYDDGDIQIVNATHVIYKPLEEVLQ